MAPSRGLFSDWLRAGDSHDVQGTPSASAHQQDEYTVAADVRFVCKESASRGGLQGESIHGHYGGEGASLPWSFRVILRLSPHRTIRVVFGVKNEDQVEGARLGREQCHD